MEHFVGGKLNLKGSALDVKGGLKKKKKKKQGLSSTQLEALKQAQEALKKDELKGKEKEPEVPIDGDEGEEGTSYVEDFRTPAEKRYHEQLEKLESARSAKLASKSHRQKIEDFNQYLANLSEHYDIPKVGPG